MLRRTQPFVKQGTLSGSSKGGAPSLTNVTSCQIDTTLGGDALGTALEWGHRRKDVRSSSLTSRSITTPGVQGKLVPPADKDEGHSPYPDYPLLPQDGETTPAQKMTSSQETQQGRPQTKPISAGRAQL
jgi:hypothetical protein